MARPSDYTKELSDKICEGISLGMSIKKVIETNPELPEISTIFRWLREREEFRNNYEQAQVERSEAQHEMLIDIGDESIDKAQHVDFKASNAVVSAYKLKADNFKWVMARMKPKKYGDKIDHTTNGKDLPAPIYGGSTTTNL